MARRAEDDIERPLRPMRPMRPAPDPRFLFTKDRLLHELRRICPEELDHFPNASTFNFWIGVSDDRTQRFKLLEIGHVWPRNTAQEAEGMGPETLFVADKGAYHSEDPDLVPYTNQGDSQRFIVDANGFVPSGVFEHFRHYIGSHDSNPRLNDPQIVSLVQFIFIIRDMRRYYIYTARQSAPRHVQLAPLVDALRVATYRSRLAARTLFLPMNGTRAPGIHPQALLDPRLVAKDNELTTTQGRPPYGVFANGHPHNNVAVNGSGVNGVGTLIRTTTNGAFSNGTMRNGTATRRSTPNGLGAGGSNQVTSDRASSNGVMGNGTTTGRSTPNGTGTGGLVQVISNGSFSNNVTENGISSGGSTPNGVEAGGFDQMTSNGTFSNGTTEDGDTTEGSTPDMTPDLTSDMTGAGSETSLPVTDNDSSA